MLNVLVKTNVAPKKYTFHPIGYFSWKLTEFLKYSLSAKISLLYFLAEDWSNSQSVQFRPKLITKFS